PGLGAGRAPSRGQPAALAREAVGLADREPDHRAHVANRSGALVLAALLRRLEYLLGAGKAAARSVRTHANRHRVVDSGEGDGERSIGSRSSRRPRPIPATGEDAPAL